MKMTLKRKRNLILMNLLGLLVMEILKILLKFYIKKDLRR